MKKKLVWVVPVFVMVAIFLLFRFVLFIGYVPTESMEPTIPKGSCIIGTRIFGKLEAGDIIVFHRAGKLLVKRIAAVGGDTVAHQGKKMVVPEEYFYVLGDNRDASWDSRYWKDIFLSKDSVVAFLGNRSRQKFL